MTSDLHFFQVISSSLPSLLHSCSSFSDPSSLTSSLRSKLLRSSRLLASSFRCWPRVRFPSTTDIHQSCTRASLQVFSQSTNLVARRVVVSTLVVRLKASSPKATRHLAVRVRWAVVVPARACSTSAPASLRVAVLHLTQARRSSGHLQRLTCPWLASARQPDPGGFRRAQ